MNGFIEKRCALGLAAVLLGIPAAFAGTITLQDATGATVATATVSGEDSQITLNSADSLATINQLLGLGLDAAAVTSMLVDAGIDPVVLTEVFVAAYPEYAVQIVEKAAKAAPDKAADVAAAAATLAPEQAVDIAGAAAKSITSQEQATQIALQVGTAVNAAKFNGEPSLLGRSIASSIASNVPASLQNQVNTESGIDALADATTGSRTTTSEQGAGDDDDSTDDSQENPSQSTEQNPVSASPS